MTKSLVLLSFFFSFFALNAQIAESVEDIRPSKVIGDDVPKTMLTNVDGEAKPIQKYLNDKKTVLVVYRGGWCPYCSAQLSGLGQIEEDLTDLGYQIIAVSPDNNEESKELLEEIQVKYTILSDESTEFIQGLGIAFYRNKKKGVLPAPAVYILNEKGTIEFQNINKKYNKRLNEGVLLAVAKALQKAEE